MNDHLRQLLSAQSPELVPVLSEKEIKEKVASLARRISSEYQDRKLLLIAVLKGAFVFLSDLARQLSVPVEIEFIRVSSYGESDTSCGEISVLNDIPAGLQGKDVLVVEDIIDTGLTMSRLVEHLQELGPESLKVCTLIDKYERRKIQFEADYVCHSVKGGFLVGYGLDYAEQYRNLPAIYELKFEQERDLVR